MATGIDDEVTLRANREGILKFQLRPRRLVDVATIDMTTELLGTRFDSPIVIAPTGSNRAFHSDGEVAVANAARDGQSLANSVLGGDDFDRGGDCRPRCSPRRYLSAMGGDRSDMAEYGEWNRKGAVLSDVTAEKEYGVTRDFIVKGVQAGELEFREGAVWGNPYLRILRSQLERYIVAQLGAEYLVRKKSHNELRAIRKEIVGLKKKLAILEARKAALECAIKT